jgi:hypothetical protein
MTAMWQPRNGSCTLTTLILNIGEKKTEASIVQFIRREELSPKVDTLQHGKENIRLHTCT